MESKYMISNQGSGRTGTLKKKEPSSQRHERIYKNIRERICLLTYPPGTILSETELAAEFEVSRTPVRRVVQQLHFEGLVEIKNGVGTIVTDIDLKTFKDIYDFRMRLAELIGELSPAQVTDAQIETMEQLLARAKAIRNSPDIANYARINNDLLELLLDLIGSGPLRETSERLYYRVARIWYTFLPDLDWSKSVAAVEAEMTEILEAMRRNDVRAVGKVRSRYLHDILTRVSEYIGGN